MPIKNDRYIAGANIPASGPFPVGMTIAGTVTSLGTLITGTGTTFISNPNFPIAPGWYLYNPTSNEVRRILFINSDTQLIIDNPFTSEMTAQNLQVTSGIYTSVILTCTAAATIDGNAYQSGEVISFNSDRGVLPFSYSGGVTLTVSYNK